MALTQISDAGLKKPASDLQDNEKIVLGTGNDLEIYHNGSNSLIVDNGTGGLIIGVSGTGTSGFYKDTGGEALATFEPDGPVKLYHNNVKKVETISTGAKVTGSLGVNTDPSKTFHVLGDSGSELPIHWIRGGSSVGGYLYSDGGGSGIVGGDGVLANTGMYLVTDTRIDFRVNGSERMRIDDSGRLLLGTTSVGSASAYYDNLIISNTTSGEGSGITFFANATNGFSAIDFADTDAVGRGRITYSHADDDLRIDTAGSERLRITSNGEVLIGHTAVIGHQGIDGALQVTGTTSDNSSFNLTRFSADNWCPFITIGKSRNATKGSHTVVQDNDYLGYINFAGSDGTDFNNSAAYIAARIDGTPGTDDMPGRLEFSTTSDGNNSASLRLTIDSTGDVKIEDGDLVIGTAGHGIDFSATAGSGTSELLDDYEEGTWTPTVEFGGASTGVTYHGNTGGSYVKIGRQVILHGRIRLSSKGTSTGAATIGGFPFTSLNITSGTSSVEGDAYFGYLHDIVSGEDHAHVTGTIDQNTTAIKVWWNDDSGDIVQLDDGDFQNGTSVSFGCTYPA